MASLDLPDQPDEPRRPEHTGASGGNRLTPKSREMPDPDERGRVYEAMQAHVVGDLTERSGQVPAPEQRRAGTEKSSYQDELPRFLDIWTDHERRWPGKSQSVVDRSADPDCTEAIGRVREAESLLSKDAQAIEQENEEKGWLEGFENRLKGADRLKEKVADQQESEPDKSPTEILQKIPDVIRYTYCFQSENYTRGYYDIKARFEGRGCEMYYSRNYWTDLEYKGINTRWVTSEGQRFEVQLHTPDSFHAKHHVTHRAYERIRNSATSRAELRELHAFQRAVSSRIRAPDGAPDIPDYKKEGF